MGAVMAVASLASAGISAIGAISQGNAMAAQSNYEAQVARNNQTIAYQNANYATAAAETKSYEEGLRQRQIAGAIAGGIAAGGVDVNSGSAARVRESADAMGTTDVATVRQQGQLTSYGYRTQASNFGAQASLDTQQAGYDQEAGWMRGLGSLVGGFSKVGTGGIESLFGSGSGVPTDADLQSWGVSSGPNNPYYTTP